MFQKYLSTRHQTMFTHSDTDQEEDLCNLAQALNVKFGERVVTIHAYPEHDIVAGRGNATFVVWFHEFGDHEDTAQTWCLPRADYNTQRNVLSMMLKLVNNPMKDGEQLGWPANLSNQGERQ